MFVLVGAHLIAAMVCAVGGRRLGRGVFAVVAAPLAASAVWLAMQAASVLGGETRSQQATWVGGPDGFAIRMNVRLDGFALLMGLLVTVIGVLVAAYSVSYFAEAEDSGQTHPAHEPADDHGQTHHAINLGVFSAALVAFAGSMLGLVLANDVLTLFVFWELTSVTSFLLIGINDRDEAAQSAAKRALLVTGGGGIAMLAGLILLAQEAGTTELSAIVEAAPRGTLVNVAVVLVLLGALTKSAQFPFHFWLPGAMKAPTPVSSYLHSATMVKAGIVLIARFAPGFATTAPWRPIVVACGLASLIWGGWRALRQSDAKLTLAQGTVSQLGLLVVLFGVGVPAATYAGVAMLLAHAVFKAGLFLTVGIVDHQLHSREYSDLGGLARRWPVLAFAAGCAALSMAGLPPMFGFATKEKALDALVNSGLGWRWFVLVVVVIGSAMTFAYSVRWWWLIFGPRRAGHGADGDAPSASFIAPAVLLGVGSLALGIASSPVGKSVADIAVTLDEKAAKKLSLWAGFNTALLLTFVVVVLGVVVARFAGALTKRPNHGPDGEEAFDRTYSGLIAGAKQLTGIVQPGSLPVYVVVIAAVLYGVFGATILNGLTFNTDEMVLANSPAQLAIAVLAIVMAIGVAVVRRRFAAVMLLGGIGYAMAAIFLLYGAPDLALTQLLVETLSIVVFLLALRDLPPKFVSTTARTVSVLRIALCAAVGIGVTVFALSAGTYPSGPSPTEVFEKLSAKDAGGLNVVNVILVDFRGSDTMGEITVLLLAAIGVANLVAAVRRSRRNDAARGLADAERTSAAEGSPSLIVDGVTHALFPVVLLLSLFLTFRGHNSPGGGFAGGLVVGGGLAIRYLAGGTRALGRLVKLPSSYVMGVGLLVSMATAIIPLLVGNAFLESSIYLLDVPVIGEVKVVSSAFFDLGVYILVIGVCLAVLTQLGESDRVDELASPLVDDDSRRDSSSVSLTALRTSEGVS